MDALNTAIVGVCCYRTATTGILSGDGLADPLPLAPSSGSGSWTKNAEPPLLAPFVIVDVPPDNKAGSRPVVAGQHEQQTLAGKDTIARAWSILAGHFALLGHRLRTGSGEGASFIASIRDLCDVLGKWLETDMPYDVHPDSRTMGNRSWREADMVILQTELVSYMDAAKANQKKVKMYLAGL